MSVIAANEPQPAVAARWPRVWGRAIRNLDPWRGRLAAGYADVALDDLRL